MATNCGEEEPAAKKMRKESASSYKEIGAHSSPAETGDSKESITNKVYNENYLARKASQKSAMQRPKVFLTVKNSGISCRPAEDTVTKNTDKQSPQLFAFDLQCLLMFALRRGWKCICPRWCCMLRPGKASSLVLVVLNDVSAADFQQHADCFPFLSQTFSENLRVEMVSPSQYHSRLDLDIYAVPVDTNQIKDLTKWNGFTLPKNGKKLVFRTKATGTCNSDSRDSKEAKESKGEPGTNKLTKIQLLLSAEQMLEEKYPMPVDRDDERYSQYLEFVFSKERYVGVRPDSPMFSVDCEMCLTTAFQSELTRVSVVNEQSEVIYDELVKPRNHIINYLTKYSGITKKMLEPVTKRIEDVQREISDLLPPDAILCGQSLNNDLCALKMFHPYVIDTSVIYNMSGSRRFKCSLRALASHFLGRTIQVSEGGHCSTEDASAAMDLVKLKLKNNLAFGDAVLGEENVPAETNAPFKLFYLGNPDQTDASAASASSQPLGPDGNENKAEDSARKDAVKDIPKVMEDKLQEQFPLRKDAQVHGLFGFLEKFGISVCLIGREKLVSRYQKEPQLKCVTTDSDKKACKEAAKASQDTKFTWVEFSAFSDLQTAETQSEERDSAEQRLHEQREPDLEQRKMTLRKLDKHVKKLVKKLPEKSLVAVAMTGRRSGKQHLNAATFLHVT